MTTTFSDRTTAPAAQGLEFSFADILTEPKTPQTLTEKIVQAHAVGLPEGKVVRSGDYVQTEPHRCMSHDNTAAILNKYRSLGAKRIKKPNQLVFAIDHDVQNKSASNLAKYEKIAAFAKEQGVPYFPAGYGIGHQVMVGSPNMNRVVMAMDSNDLLGRGALCLARKDVCRLRFARQSLWWHFCTGNGSCKDGCCCYMGYEPIMVCVRNVVRILLMIMS